MSASQSGVFNVQQFTDAGTPLVSGRLYTYVYGTTTQKTAFTDAAGLIPHTYTSDGVGGLYLALNARGELPAPLYLAPGSYDLALKRADGSTVWTRSSQGSPTADSEYANKTDITKGSALIGVFKSFTSYIGKTLAQWLGWQPVSVFEFMTDAQIADVQAGTGLLDVTAAVQAAATTGRKLILPAGGYFISDKITFVNAQVIQGEGRTKSFFIVRSGFNLSATSVLQLGTGEPGSQLLDVGIKFDQPDQSVRANCIQYPWAVDISTMPRAIIDNLRLEGAWNGIKGIGNCGGSYVGFIEIGALNKGVSIDGALDFLHGGAWHFWPFGMTAKPLLLNNVYYDNTTIAAEMGRIDGSNIASISTFRTIVKFLAAASSGTPSLVGMIRLDGDGARMIVEGGNTSVGQLYDTKSVTGTALPSVLVSAGNCVVGQALTATSHAAPSFQTSGTGTLIVNGGRINHNNTGANCALSAGGALTLNNLMLTFPAVAFTVPHVTNSGTGILQVRNCRWVGKGAGSGTCVALGNDLADNFIAGNEFRDWTYTAPVDYLNGVYGPNAQAMKSWTPVASFSTNGDFAPTYTVQLGRYREETGGVRFECRLVFSTNAYTTAAGGFSVSGPPVLKGASTTDSTPVTIGRMAKFTMTGGYTMLSASMPNSASRFDFLQSGSGAAVIGAGISSVPPSTTGVEVSISGFIPNF